MELKHYTLAKLEELIRSGNYLNDEVVPITPLRVYSQQKNPKAKLDDVVLTIAYAAEGQILGYIGALPEVVEGVRCAWNSCWWVKPGAPAEVSMKLFAAFVSTWDRNVLFSEMTPLTSSIIQRLGFCRHETLTGFKGYYRFAMAEVFPRKKVFFKRAKGSLMMADYLLNQLLNCRSVFFKRKNFEGIQIDVTPNLNDSDNAFIQQFNRKQPAKRLSGDFNWIGENPWVVEQNKADGQVRKGYYFSYAVNRFCSEWVRFKQGGKLLALVNFTIKNDELKLPYVYGSESNARLITDYCMHLLQTDRKLAAITVFDKHVVSILNKQKGFVFKTSLPKYSAISKGLLEKAGLAGFELQMGDGDCVFT